LAAVLRVALVPAFFAAVLRVAVVPAFFAALLRVAPAPLFFAAVLRVEAALRAADGRPLPSPALRLVATVGPCPVTSRPTRRLAPASSPPARLALERIPPALLPALALPVPTLPAPVLRAVAIGVSGVHGDPWLITRRIHAG
jgi:hypothetical protein